MALSYTVAAATPTTTVVAKTKVFLGTTASDPTTDSFVEIGGVAELPNFGPSETPIKVQLVGQDLELTLKGVTTLGGGSLKSVDDPSDAGQTAMLAAQNNKTDNYNIRFVLPDGPSGSDVITSVSHGTLFDIKAKVLGSQLVLGGPNNAIYRQFDLGFNTKPTRTAKA